MSVFAIGDTHLSLGTDKSMTVFRGWDDYVDRLGKNWRAVVTDDDSVVIAGDVSWSMKLEDCGADFAFLDSLPGKKYIVKGNHDYWWETMRKMEAYVSANGFDSISFIFNNSVSVGDYALCGTRGWFFDDESEHSAKVIARERERLRRSVESGLAAGKEPIVFLHYPPFFDGRQVDEIWSVLTEYKIRRCFFGHIHGETTGRYDSFTRDGISFGLISADRLGFCPKLIQKIP